MRYLISKHSVTTEICYSMKILLFQSMSYSVHYFIYNKYDILNSGHYLYLLLLTFYWINYSIKETEILFI